MNADISRDILLIVLAGLAGGLVARMFRAPLLIGYLIAGLLVGPHSSGIRVGNPEIVENLADIGAALLLFSLGLEFPLKSLRTIRNIAFFGTAIQVALTFIFCTALALVLGFELNPAFWFGAAFLSSSTAVILKTLANQGHAGSLSGRVMLGMSIVQDLMVIPVMILLANYANAAEGVIAIAIPLVYALIFIALMVVIGSKVTPVVLHFVAKLHSRELFLLVITALALGVGFLTSRFGLSLAFGALVAGMVLSESDYSHKALSELGPLRDIFVLIFFVSVGMLSDPAYLKSNWLLVLGVTAVATIGRGMVLAGVSLLFKFRNVVPFALFFGMLPVSEITFVLIQQGSSIGAVDAKLYSLLLNVTLFSMLLGPLAANLTTPCYRLFRKFHPPKAARKHEFNLPEVVAPEIVLTGESPVEYVMAFLARLGRPYVAVEPQFRRFAMLKKGGHPVIFGDPAHEAIWAAAGTVKAQLLLVASGDATAARESIRAARAVNPGLKVLLLLEDTTLWKDGDDDVTMIPSSRAAGLETLRLLLLALGWSMPKVHSSLQKIEDDELGAKALEFDRHGFPMISRFFSTAEHEITGESRWHHCAVRESRLREEFGLILLGVAREGSFIQFPDGDFELQAGDRMLLIGDRENCDLFLTAV
ncbi:MAG: cation:proton antiporter [Victivallaceae bacterium]